MKKLCLLILLLLSVSISAQEYDFTLSVQNQQVNGTDFTFDIYMLRTGSQDIYLGDCDFALDFNSGNFTSPVVSVETADTQLWTWYSLSPAIVATNRIVLNVGKPTFNDQTQFDARIQIIGTTGNGTLIGTIKLTNVSNPSGTSGLAWRTSGENVTVVNRFDTTTPWDQHNIDAYGTYTAPQDVTLPVELSAFTAKSTRDGVLLEWSTQSEHNNLGYILTKKTEEQDWVTVASYKSHDELKGQGNSTSPQEYSFTDSQVSNGQVITYRLSDVDRQGKAEVKKEIEITVTAMVPGTTALLRPYPNPFNPVTTIRYDLAEEALVSVSVFNLRGQQVAELVKGRQQAGEQSVSWNAANMPSGMYFIRMKADNYIHTQKCMLLK